MPRWLCSAALGCLLSCLLGWASGCAGPSKRVAPEPGTHADVIAVQVVGDAGDYVFSVAVASPDAGCQRYADWWEVVSSDGQLIHRRILAHSHVNEQPFTRSSGPVAIAADDVVVVRAHLSTAGYGGAVMRGSVAQGFASAPNTSAEFAANLADMQPLPDGCAF